MKHGRLDTVLPLLLAVLLAGALTRPCAAQLTDTHWTEMGRGIFTDAAGVRNARGGKHHQSGRAWQLSAVVDPEQNGHTTLWVGTSHGGLWKSILDSDGKIASFEPETDKLEGPHTLGSFVVHRDDPTRILFGPGSAAWGNGDGNIYKSTDGGESWTPFPLPTGAASIHRVNRMLEAPDDPAVVLAATSTGIYRSADFGSSWQQVFKGAKSGTLDEVTDVVVDTGNPTTFYAADPASQYKDRGTLVKILRSTDGGMSWDPYAPSAARIIGSTARIKLATCTSDAGVLYALATTAKTGSTANGGLNGVYRSLDRGQSWTNIFPATTANSNAIDKANQGFHAGAIACDPTDPSHIVFGVKDAAETFHARRDDVSTIDFITTDKDGNFPFDTGHGDLNDLLFRSDGGVLFTATDGGVYIYHPDTRNVDDSLNLLGIDALELTPNRGGFVSGRSYTGLFLAGLQDNGVIRGDAGGDLSVPLLLLAPGDGGDVTVNPFDVLAIGATSSLFPSGFRSLSPDLGSNWSGIDGSLAAPVSAATPRLLIDPAQFFVGNRLILTSAPAGKSSGLAGIYFSRVLDNVQNWAPVGTQFRTGTVSHLDHTTSTTDHDIVFTLKGSRRLGHYFGPRGTLGSLQFEWMTPRLKPLTTGATRDARVNADRSPTRPETIYYTTGISRPSQAFVWLPPAENLGTSHWSNVTGALPGSMDFNRLVANPSNLDQLFLATSDGVWRSDSGGVCWTRWSRGLRRNEVVLDLLINAEDSPPTLYIATQGRGFWGRQIGNPTACPPPSDEEGGPSPFLETGAVFWGTTVSPELDPEEK